MTASSSTLQALTEAAADAVGREIARLRGEAKQQNDLRDAEYRARSAELETRILSAATLEKELRERLANLKDGEPGDKGEKGDKGDQGDRGEPGHDVEEITVTQTGAIVEFGFQVDDVRTVFEVELPAGDKGDKGDQGDRGLEGPAGKLSSVEPWSDQVHYEGAIRTHAGATWQALRDTAKEPPHEDWACIAARGIDGRSFEPKGAYDPEGEYQALDVVALNGGSFIALKDQPGPCPGDGWRLLVSRGSRGERGEKGLRGERGPAGPSIKEMEVDGEGLLTLTNADGSVVTCDLYPVLSKIGQC